MGSVKSGLKNSYIIHKTQTGSVDLTFNKTAGKEFLFKILEEKIHQMGYKNVKAVKSMTFRIKVPVIDFDQPFEKCSLKDLDTCLEACEQLSDLADVISYFSEITVEDE